MCMNICCVAKATETGGTVWITSSLTLMLCFFAFNLFSFDAEEILAKVCQNMKSLKRFQPLQFSYAARIIKTKENIRNLSPR